MASWDGEDEDFVRKAYWTAMNSDEDAAGTSDALGFQTSGSSLSSAIIVNSSNVQFGHENVAIVRQDVTCNFNRNTNVYVQEQSDAVPSESFEVVGTSGPSLDQTGDGAADGDLGTRRGGGRDAVQRVLSAIEHMDMAGRDVSDAYGPGSRDEFDILMDQCQCCYDVKRRKSMIRFCLSGMVKPTMNSVEELAALVESLAIIDDKKFMYYCIVMGGAAMVMRDLQNYGNLGRLFLRTSNDPACPVVTYSNPRYMTAETSAFVAGAADRLRSISGYIRLHCDRKASYGLCAAVYMLDGVCRCLFGFREDCIGPFIRATCAMMASQHMDVYTSCMDTQHVRDIMYLFLERLCLRRLCLPNYSLFGLGLRDQFFVGGFSCRCAEQTVSSYLDKNVQEMLLFMRKGTAVSINVTRGAGDPLLKIAHMASQLQIIRTTQRVRSRLRIYFDSWSWHATGILEYILGLDEEVFSGLSFGINVVSPLFDAISPNGSGTWALWNFDWCSSFSKENMDQFISRLKRARPAADNERCIVVSARWFCEKIAQCVLTGRLAVVYPENVHNHSVLNDLYQPIQCLGPGVNFENPFSRETLPVVSVSVNLEECVADVVPDCMHDNEMMYIYASSDWAIDSAHLRMLVEHAVVCGNAMLDSMIKNCGGESSKLAERFRRFAALAVNVTGFHKALMKLDVEYDSNEAVELCRKIHEHVYYEALKTSMSLCRAGASACTWFGRTMYARGIMMFDRYSVTPTSVPTKHWIVLRQNIMRHGLRNAFITSCQDPEDGVCLMTEGSVSILPILKNHYISHALIPRVEGFREEGFCHIDRRAGEDVPFVGIPVVNNLLIREEPRVQMAVSDRKWGVSDRTCIFRDAFDIGMDRVLAMCAAASPFVDQVVAPSFCVQDGDGVGAILEALKRAYDLRLKVGVVRCYAAKSFRNR
uniref:GP45 n=1 Tax=Caviid herpesvirus 2 str. CIDMTR TaxID=1415526 RepID=U6HC18_9BETA|nr:GP45 [Caviid herpesvirus 2 str. CIDMTR]